MKTTTRNTKTKARTAKNTSTKYIAGLNLFLFGTGIAWAQGDQVTVVGSNVNENIDITYQTIGTESESAIAVKANLNENIESLSGKIVLSTGDSTNTDVKDRLFGLWLESSSKDSVTEMTNLSIQIDAYPPAAEGVISESNEIYGISGNTYDTISLTNTDITINAGSNASNSWIYAIGHQQYGVGMRVGIVDAESSIVIRDTDPGVSRYAGILARDIQEFHGSIDIQSISNTIGASSQGAGINIKWGQGDAILAGSIKVDAAAKATGISLVGGADSISSTIETSSYGAAVGIVVRANDSGVNSISSDITATGLAGAADHGVTLHPGSATGIHVEAGRIENISSHITVSGVGSYVFGTILYNTVFTDDYSGPSAGTISGTTKVHNTNTIYVNDTAGLASHLGTSLTYTDGTVHATGFDAFTGTIEATGTHNAVGMDLRAGYQIPEAQEGSLTRLNESGVISGSISAITDDTYVVRPGETDESGEMIPELNGNREEIHAKSTVAIRVDEGIETFEQVDNVNDLFPDGTPSRNDPNEAKVQKATLNFGNGASVVAKVGDTYGDAIGFATANLALRTVNANDRVTLFGDITSVGHGGFIKTGADAITITTDNSPTGTLIGDRGLQFEKGIYDVSSDYWFVDRVSLGTILDSSTSQVNLADSTKLVDTHTLDFHVNSDASYSQMAIANSEQMTINELQNINVTLGEELMSTSIFRVTLIDGDMIDSMGGTLTVSLIDLLPGGTDGLEDDLSSIYVEYDGIRKYYGTDGVQFTYDGTATDFVIGRGPSDVIPEPSTTTLSLLALAGILARRRRRMMQRDI